VEYVQNTVYVGISVRANVV